MPHLEFVVEVSGLCGKRVNLKRHFKALLAGALKLVSDGYPVGSVLNIFFVLTFFLLLLLSKEWAKVLGREGKFLFQGNCFCLVESTRFSAVTVLGVCAKGGFDHSCT